MNQRQGGTGIGLGAIIRHTAGAISALFGLFSAGITIAVGAGYAALALIAACSLITRRDP